MKDCPFCYVEPSERVFYSDDLVTAFLTKDAIAPGQSLVITNRHVENISQLHTSEISRVFCICSKITSILINKLKADGVNIINNINFEAGQTVSHFHVHVVPRYKNDIDDPKLLFNPKLYEKLYQLTSKEYIKLSNKMKLWIKENNKNESKKNVNTSHFPKVVKYGKNVYFSSNVEFFGKCEIGDFSFIGNNVTIGHPSVQEIRIFFRPLKSQRKKNMNEIIQATTKIGNEAIIRSGSAIYSGVSIGKKFDCGHNVLIRERTRIGNNVYVAPGSHIHADVIVGDNVRIYGVLCNRSVVEEGASVYGSLVHKYKSGMGGFIEDSPVIKKRAIVGWNSVIVGGIEIGEKSFVGPNSVVTEDIPPEIIVSGIPAKKISMRR